MNTDGYINYNDVLSYNAPYNFINAVRGVGKSFAGKIRAPKRFRRCGEGMIWVRRTREDTKRTRATFFNKKFFRYSGENPDNIRIRGEYAEIKIGKSWERFIEFVTLSGASNERSADDSLYTLMVLDEGFVTQAKRNQYRGDEVNDFLDLYDSKRRDGKMQALILGNRESVSNPYLAYFGIDTPPMEWEGIRAYKDNTIVYMQRTTPMETANDMDKKVKRALDGTKYGRFKYDGQADGMDFVHIKKKPKDARLYCSFLTDYRLSAWYKNGDIYFQSGFDDTARFFAFKPINNKNALIYTLNDKRNFTTLIEAKRRNAIYYDTPATAEAVAMLLQMMNI